jgi:hypothetical protein
MTEEATREAALPEAIRGSALWRLAALGAGRMFMLRTAVLRTDKRSLP